MKTDSLVRSHNKVQESQTKDRQVESKDSLPITFLPVTNITIIVDSYEKVHVGVQLPNLPGERGSVSAQVNFSIGEGSKWAEENFPNVPIDIIHCAKHIHFSKETI